MEVIPKLFLLPLYSTDYKSPLIDRCWYIPYSEDDFDLYEDVMFIEYGWVFIDKSAEN